MKDQRKKIIGFLSAKGLLFAPDVTPQPTVKLDLGEVIQFGMEHEPRVLEVLPAALIHFPKTFLRQENIPNALKEILEKVKRGDISGHSFHGIQYQDMLRWARKKLPDNRTVPIAEKRIMKSFRLKPGNVVKLKNLAKELRITETQVLEKTIEEMAP